jgi:hypothetical protein
MIGVLPSSDRWTFRAGTIDFCPAFAALVSPIQNIIFLTALFFTLLVPSRPATWVGRQACWVACLCVSGQSGAVRSSPQAESTRNNLLYAESAEI